MYVIPPLPHSVRRPLCRDSYANDALFIHRQGRTAARKCS
jgi:hypothetical protein